MWREKGEDLKRIERFLDNLKEFQHRKRSTWERIDEETQKNNFPGVPGEDWIIPPDENHVANELELDPDYRRLRNEIGEGIKPIKQIAEFLHFNEHHEFDWINFNSPLIGNEALEAGITITEKLKRDCEHKNYPFQNLVALFQISK